MSLAAFFPALASIDFLQSTVIAGSFFLLFLLIYTLKDIVLRTHSFWYQAICVLLTGALPIAGFLLYLLIRPARTIKERELEEMIRDLAARPSGDNHERYAEDGPVAEPVEPDQPTL